MILTFSEATWAAILAQPNSATRAQAIVTLLGADSTIEFRDAADAVIRTITVPSWAVGATANGKTPIAPSSYTDAALGTGTPVTAVFKADATEVFRCSCGTAAGNFYRLLANIVAGVPIILGNFAITLSDPAGTKTGPTLLTAPSISGTPQVGSTIVFSFASWSGADTVTREMLRNGVVIGPVTGSTYTVVALDQGAYMVLRETATNADGTSVSTSNAIGPIAPLALGFSALPDTLRLYKGVPYELSRHVVGGVPPYSGYAVDAGTLPANVTLDADTGTLLADESATEQTVAGIQFGVDDSDLGSLASMLGALVHDGPATPEQISLYMTVDGSLDASTTIKATTRYRLVGGSWVQAHPMFHIRNGPSIRSGRVPAFANVITGLTPGQDYEVEVTVVDGAQSVVKTLACTTRALPAAAGPATVTIAAGSTSTQIQSVFNAAVPGAVIEFESGTYTLPANGLSKSGTEAEPIYVRGASRDGVRLLGRLRLIGPSNGTMSNVVIENLTIEGSGVDSGTSASSYGIDGWDGSSYDRITIRNCTIEKVDQGVLFRGRSTGILVYDNTLSGNNAYTQPNLESNLTWNDDGVMIAGAGNVAFNNTLSGFGDSFAVNSGANSRGVHFYRNRVLYGGDDGAELDYADRNISFYDNRIANTMTTFSCDPVYSGPCFVFRNVWINVGRQTFKLNNNNLGVLVYSNTIVRQRGRLDTLSAEYPFLSFNDGAQCDWAFRNNLLVWADEIPAHGYVVRQEFATNERIDWTHNGWNYDGRFVWPGGFGSGSAPNNTLANVQTKTDTKIPLFGTQVRRHENDRIVESNPFAAAVTLPDPYHSAVADGSQSVALAPSSVARNAGIHIPGITDGYSGAAPDMGAVISGRAAPVVGDRSS